MNPYIVKHVKNFNMVSLAHNDIVRLSRDPSICEIQKVLAEINIQTPSDIKKKEIEEGITIMHGQHAIIKFQHLHIAKSKHNFADIDNGVVVAKFNRDFDKIEVFKKGAYLSTVAYFDDPKEVKRFIQSFMPTTLD